MRERYTPPLHPPGRAALFLRAPLQPLSPPSRVSGLCHTAHEESLFICATKNPTPPGPTPRAARGWSPGPRRTSLVGCAGGDTGPEDLRLWPSGRARHPPGPHGRLHGRASALRHAGVAGAEAGLAVADCYVRWPVLFQRQAAAPGRPGEAPGPPPGAQSRGSAGLEICALETIFQM